MKKLYVRRWLAALSSVLLFAQTGAVSGGVLAETSEQTVVRFSASDTTTQKLMYGYSFYTDWKTGDGLDTVGADLSGTADNGAHKKMSLKATVTLTALDESVDVASCWKQLGFRLRSSHVGNEEKAADFYDILPAQTTMAGDSIEVDIPLSAIGEGNIDWTDVRQLNVTCTVADTYKLPGEGNSDKIQFALSGARIVREVTVGAVDKDELTELINASINDAEYTSESLAAYKQAVEAGKTVRDNPAATQEQVDSAARAIKTARRALVSTKETYKGTLRALLDEECPTEGYTADSLAAYQAVLDAGQPVVSDTDATQQQVNQAVMDIMTAKMNLTPAVPDEQFQSLVTFSGFNNTWNTLNSGRNFYTDWKTGDGLTDANSDQPGFDASGAADNGSDPLVYLQMRVAFTALSADADAETCWKQIGMRLRSSAVDKKEQAADFYYIKADMLVPQEDGSYLVRIPLRAMSTGSINWADIKQLNILAEVNTPYLITGSDGNPKTGNSEKICFTLGQVQLVKKIVQSKGDVNNSGKVTAEDALLALQAATKKITLNAIETDAADVDGKEGVTAADALLILQYTTQKIDSLEREEKKMVAFTFDDGPSENTAAFLDALKERNVHATFFVIGKQAEQHPELVARMAAEGHEVGNHSYSHDGFNITTRDEMIEDYGKCSDLIEQYTGKRPTLMRAVGGTSVEAISDYVKEQGLRLCGWKGGGDDYNQTDKDVVVNFYMKDGKCTISDGDLVLLHENHASSVAAALELIDRLLADGYEIVTVQELLDARANGGTSGTLYDRVVSLD